MSWRGQKDTPQLLLLACHGVAWFGVGAMQWQRLTLVVDDGVQADTLRANGHQRARRPINPDHAAIRRARIRPRAVNGHFRRTADRPLVNH